jgi:hypothetical protein
MHEDSSVSDLDGSRYSGSDYRLVRHCAQHVAKLRAYRRAETLHETARATALTVDRELVGAEAALRVLASSRALAAGNLRDFHKQAKTADRGPDAWTLLLDQDGRQIINTVVPFGTPPPAPPSSLAAAWCIQSIVQRSRLQRLAVARHRNRANQA